MRITLSEREGGGVTRESKMFAPNINIDYDLHVEGQMKLPLINRAIKLDPEYAEAYYHKQEYDKAWEDVHKVRSLRKEPSPEFIEKLREASGREE